MPSLFADTGKFEVVGVKGFSSFVPTSADTTHVTVVEIVGADGSKMDPCFIYARKTFGDMAPSCGDATLIACTKEGWITGEVFGGVLQKFIDWTSPVRQTGFIVLTYDGCPCHFVYKAIHNAASNKTVIVCFPAHISHIAQPLDHSTCFGGLKKRLRRLIRDYVKSGNTLKVDNIAQLYMQAREETLTPQAIKSAFRETGIHPVDRTKLLSHGQLAPSQISSTSDSQEFTLPVFPERFKPQIEKCLASLRDRCPVMFRLSSCMWRVTAPKPAVIAAPPPLAPASASSSAAAAANPLSAASAPLAAAAASAAPAPAPVPEPSIDISVPLGRVDKLLSSDLSDAQRAELNLVRSELASAATLRALAPKRSLPPLVPKRTKTTAPARKLSSNSDKGVVLTNKEVLAELKSIEDDKIAKAAAKAAKKEEAKKKKEETHQKKEAAKQKKEEGKQKKGKAKKKEDAEQTEEAEQKQAAEKKPKKTKAAELEQKKGKKKQKS